MSATPLSDIIERIERSIFHALRQETVDKGFLPDIVSTTDFVVSSVTIGTKTFKVTGDASSLITTGGKFILFSSTGNDKGIDTPYTLASAPVFAAGETTLIVNETIADPTIDGTIGIFIYQDTDAGVALFQTDLETIKTTKGFAVEIFNHSSSQGKEIKRIPRVVIVPNRFLPGDLGGAPDRIYEGVGPDPLNPTSFNAKIQPPQTVSFQFDIHIISNSSLQDRIIHGIVALALPKRGYIQFYDLTSSDPQPISFFIRQYSYRDIPNSIEGINEKIYLYEALDIFETEDKTVDTGIKPMKEITIEKEVGEEGDSESDGSFKVQ